MGQAASFSVRVDGPIGRSGDSTQVLAELRLFRQAADCLDDGVAITAQPTESDPPPILYVNPAFTALSGLRPTDSAGQSVGAAPSSSSLSQDDPLGKTLKESHQTNGVFSTDVVGEKNGCRTVLRLRSEPVRDQSGQTTHRVAVVRDITQQAALEEVSRRNERLASVGLLAAGIAHEINNPAGAALLAAETALAIMDSPDSGQQVAACLRNIVTSMDRCGRIVRTLLRYSREEPSEKQACSVNDVAKQALDLARPYVERRGAELRLELDPTVPLTPMNPLEIELVLLNLIRNAVEAGDEKVIVTIRSQRTAEGVRVAVSDTGCGMNPEQLAHVFDPLYTTRRQLGGSGLGMGIAYGIIREHAGQMEVQSMPGMGTTVTIDLPVAAGPLGADANRERNHRGPNPDCRR